jgi:hypothetical protein
MSLDQHFLTFFKAMEKARRGRASNKPPAIISSSQQDVLKASKTDENQFEEKQKKIFLIDFS